MKFDSERISGHVQLFNSCLLLPCFTVLNLLLQTKKAALPQVLPLYIICALLLENLYPILAEVYLFQRGFHTQYGRPAYAELDGVFRCARMDGEL